MRKSNIFKYFLTSLTLLSLLSSVAESVAPPRSSSSSTATTSTLRGDGGNPAEATLLSTRKHADGSVSAMAESSSYSGYSAIRAESALVDGETGRIYWETGGSTSSTSSGGTSRSIVAGTGGFLLWFARPSLPMSTRMASISPQLRRYHLHIPHLRALVLSSLLWVGMLGLLSQHVQNKLYSLPYSSRVATSPMFFSTVLLAILHVILSYAPRLDTKLWITIIGLYLWESYTCSTHQYLSNTIPVVNTNDHISTNISSDKKITRTTTNTPSKEDDDTNRIIASVSNSFEHYMERLRTTSPIVEWRVRSYHYEEPSASWIVMEWARLIQRIRNQSIALAYKLSQYQQPLFEKWTIIVINASQKLLSLLRILTKSSSSSSSSLPQPLIQHQELKQQLRAVSLSTTPASGTTSTGLRKRFTTKAQATYRYGGTTDRTVAQVIINKTHRLVDSQHVVLDNDMESYDDKVMSDTRGIEQWRMTWTPMAKITLSQLLVLGDGKARLDYFQQQSQFVTKHCPDNPFLEFTTNLHIPGFRPRLLVLRSPPSLPLRANALPVILPKKTITESMNTTTTTQLWNDAVSAAKTAATNVTNMTTVVAATNAIRTAIVGTSACAVELATVTAATVAASTSIAAFRVTAMIRAVATQISICVTQWMCSLVTFWLFTLLGLTVPYRHWFSSHCDEIRVWLIKETLASTEKASSSSLKTPPPPPPPAQPLVLTPTKTSTRHRRPKGRSGRFSNDDFQSVMKSLTLYSDNLDTAQ